MRFSEFSWDVLIVYNGAYDPDIRKVTSPVMRSY